MEGLAKNERLAPIQQTMIDLGGTQCGYCTPGVLMASYALLERNPNPTEREIREGLVGICAAAPATLALSMPYGRPLGSNELTWLWEGDIVTTKKPTIVGKSFQRVESNAKVTGSAQYVDDIQFGPNLLFGKLKRSTIPHGRIKAIDTSKAEALPGVRVVVTGKDFPGLTGLYLSDRPTFAVDRVRFVGEAVAGVAAETRELAEKAVELIEIEYEELPGVFDPEYGASSEAPLVHPDMMDYECAPSSSDKMARMSAIGSKCAKVIWKAVGRMLTSSTNTPTGFRISNTSPSKPTPLSGRWMAMAKLPFGAAANHPSLSVT